MGRERVDDLAQSKGEAFDQGQVDLSRGGLEILADEQTGEVGVDQHRAVAVPPVEGQQSAAPRTHGRSVTFQGVMARVALSEEARQPSEVVAEAALTSFEAVAARHHAVLHHAAHPRHHLLGRSAQDIAAGGAHDGHQDSVGALTTVAVGATDAAGRHADVGIDIADRDRDAGFQPDAGGHGRGQFAGFAAERHRRAELIDEVDQFRVQRGAELAAGIATLRAPDGFVAGGAGVAGLDPGELPHDPVGGLDEAVGGIVDRRGFVGDLGDLRKQPFRADFAAVFDQPGFTALGRQGVEAISPGLRGVVLPQLDPGMGHARPLGQGAQRGAVGGGRQDRAGGEIGADADDLGRVNAAFGENGLGREFEHVEVVERMLQRPVMAEFGAVGQGLVQHQMPIRADGGGDFTTIGDIHQDGPSRFRSKVVTDGVRHDCSWARHGRVERGWGQWSAGQEEDIL